MRIGMIAPPWFPIPPQNYGGIEFVVSLLTEGLVRRGHDVTLFATGDSRTEARLHFSYQQAPVESIGVDHSIEVVHSLAAYSRAGEFDVIHDHDGFPGRRHGRPGAGASWARPWWPPCTAPPTPPRSAC